MDDRMTLEIFLGTILRSIEIAKMFHLEAYRGKMVTHEALGEYYDAAAPILDSVYEETAAHVEIGDLKSLITKNNMKTPEQLLNTVRKFITTERDSVYNAEVSPNIFSHLDDFISLIDQCLYKMKHLNEGLEAAKQTEEAIAEVQRQYLSGELTYNGIVVKDWFNKMIDNFISQIQNNLGVGYRSMSRNIAGVFFSNVSKDYIVVLESYRHGHHALAVTKMYDIYRPEPVSGVRYFKAESNEELCEFINKVDKTMIPIFLNCRCIEVTQPIVESRN